MSDRMPDLVSIPATALASLLGVSGSGSDPSEAAAYLRELGIECANALKERFLQHLATGPTGGTAPDDDSSEFWAALSLFFEQLGWGRLEHEHLHPGVFSLSSGDWFEAEESRSQHPKCHFSTGVLAELLRTIAEADLAAMEVDCRAAGGSRCSFLLGGPVALEAVFADMASGREYGEAIAALS